MVKAAVRAIRRLGPAVTMADIAREAGVSKPILYRQFTGKTDLHAEVAATATAALIAELQAASDREAQRHGQLTSVINAYLAYVGRERRLVGFLRQTPTSSTASTGQPAQQFASTLATRISIMLRDELPANGADPGPTDAWAVALVGYVQAAADWWVSGQAVPQTVVAEQLAWLIWNGLAGLGRGEVQVGMWP
ncbi:MAG TPA: TetR/AcrR family transcriptional regulator [Candidatus Dormibacteraeota bacterium]|nr:TetR/AcrR family transcriptional regulator [Candidatus Dormibacteraeota bacterium]